MPGSTDIAGRASSAASPRLTSCWLSITNFDIAGLALDAGETVLIDALESGVRRGSDPAEFRFSQIHRAPRPRRRQVDDENLIPGGRNWSTQHWW